jgi:hypothetical protein
MKQQQAAAAERAAACGMCTLVAVSDFFKTKSGIHSTDWVQIRGGSSHSSSAALQLDCCRRTLGPTAACKAEPCRHCPSQTAQYAYYAMHQP